MSLSFIHISDNHLGAYLPYNFNYKNWDRGYDFLDNFEYIFKLIKESYQCDFIIHTGDLFDIPNPDSYLVNFVINNFVKIANLGVPIFLIPGNHEKSAFPPKIKRAHPLIYVLDNLKYKIVRIKKFKLLFYGIPYVDKREIRTYPDLLKKREVLKAKADLKFLLTHQIFAGAITGPNNYVFKPNYYIFPLKVIPRHFDLVFCGHIHLSQVLVHPEDSRIKIIYSGSSERINFNEIYDKKGFIYGNIKDRGKINLYFIPIPCKPMFLYNLDGNGSYKNLKRIIKNKLGVLPYGSSVKFIINTDQNKNIYRNLKYELKYLFPNIKLIEFKIVNRLSINT